MNAKPAIRYVVKWHGDIVERRTTNVAYTHATVTQYDEGQCLAFVESRSDNAWDTFWNTRFGKMKARGAFNACVTRWHRPDGKWLSCTARLGVPVQWRRAPYVKWERDIPVEIEPTQEAIKVADALATMPQEAQRELIAMVGNKLIADAAWDQFAVLLAQHLDINDADALVRLRQANAKVIQANGSYSKIQACYALLTPREKEVMADVVGGLRNKQIASKMGVADITVKIHRGRVMSKMGARSVAELVRFAVALQIVDDHPLA